MSFLMSAPKAALLVVASAFLAPSLHAQIVNDECGGAIAVVNGVNGPFDTTGATTSSPAWPCGLGGTDLWYVYSATCSGTVTIETCGLSSSDTTLQAFNATCTPCPSFTTGPCNDDTTGCGLQSRVSLAALQGTTIYIRLGGYTARVVQASLNITCTPVGGPVLSDNECSGAMPVGIGITSVLSTVGYTTSEPAWPCAPGVADRWFVFTPSCSGNYTFTTCTPRRTFDTTMEIFQGPCSPCGMASLACNDDDRVNCAFGSTISLALVAGGQYFIRVGGNSTASISSGNFELAISTSSAGNGSFAVASPGCGGTAITATGWPNIGGAVNFTMTPVQGVAQIWIGLFPLNVPLCASGCALGTSFDAVFGGNVIAASIPCDPTIVGARIYTQGLDLGAAGGCTVLDPLAIPFTLSNTILTTIGS